MFMTITSFADLCADLLADEEDEGKDLACADSNRHLAAWDWILARATLKAEDEALIELPPQDLLAAHHLGAMAEREDIERRFMETWAPPPGLVIALEQLVRAGIGQVIIHRDF